MFAVGDVVDADVAVLAGGEDVSLRMVHLHVVQRGLAHHVVTPRKLKSPLRILKWARRALDQQMTLYSRNPRCRNVQKIEGRGGGGLAR